jgi:hypothetical protein
MKEKRETRKLSIILIVVSLMAIITLNSNLTGSAIEQLEKNSISTLDDLLEAEKTVLDIKKLNLTTFYLEDALLEAKKYFVGKDYQFLQEESKKIQDPSRYQYFLILMEDYTTLETQERVGMNYEETNKILIKIEERKQTILNILDRISLIEEKQLSSKINTEDSKLKLEEVKKVFNQERVEEALTLLQETESILERETSEYNKVKTLTKNFFQRYWLQLIISIVILTTMAMLLKKRVRVIRAKSKLNNYETELDSLKEMMKKTQIARFRTNKLSGSIYKLRMDRYTKKLNKIKSEIPVLESIIRGKKVNKKRVKRGVLKI